MPSKAITQQTFESEVLQSDIPVLIELHAESQKPSMQMIPMLDDVADDYAGDLKVVTCDLEKNPGIAQAFRVQQIPMLILLKDGQPVDAVRGLINREQLDQKLSQVVDTSPGGVKNWEVKVAAEKLENKQVRPVDLREENDYGRTRLPGAVNAPPERFDSVIAKLKDSKKTLLFYSRDSSDIRDEAARAANAGASVAVLEGGLLGWEAEGKDVEKGSPTAELM
jgi:rhodanese-related sulfurtransferase